MSQSTDIRDLLTSAQQVVNSAVETITETQETQEFLKANIPLIETAVAEHNVDLESHEDIRIRLEEMPSIISDPIITGPAAIESGVEATWNFSAHAVIPTVEMVKFEVTDYKGVKYDVPAPTGSASWNHTFTEDRDTNGFIVVQAIATDGFVSPSITFDLFINKYEAPDLTRMLHNLPERLDPSQTYSATITGIVDNDDDLASVSIYSDIFEVTVPGEITQGVAFDIVTSSGLDRTDISGNFTVEAVDARNLKSSINIPFAINQAPIMDNFVHNIPSRISAHTSPITFNLSGAVDPESDPVTYSFEGSLTGVTISKTDNIAAFENITMTISESAEINSVLNLSIYCTDNRGAKSDGITVQSLVDTPPDMTNILVSLPARILSNGTYEFTVTGITDVNDDTVFIDIDLTGSTEGISVDKQTGISLGETITLTTTDVEAGDTSITLRARTAYSSPATHVHLTKVNAVLAETDLVSDAFPAVGIATVSSTAMDSSVDGNNIVILPITDSDNDSLTYTITTSQEGVSFVNESDNEIKIITTEAISAYAGSTFDVVLSVNDGYETVEFDKQFMVNTPPVVTTLSIAETEGISDSVFTIPVNIDNLADEGSDISELQIAVENANENLIFSKSVYAYNENISFTFKRVLDTTVATFDLVLLDKWGARSDVFEQSVTILPILVTEAPSILYPTDGLENVEYYNGFVMQISPYEDIGWTGEGDYPNN